jgi:CBS domain-containing protein
VTNDEGIVLGRLGTRALRGDPQALVEDVMESGPTTTRPGDPLDAIKERLQNRRVGGMLVTTPEGRLVGLLYREDAEQRLREVTG